MTQKEFFTAITESASLSEELRTYAAEALTKMEATAAKRAETAAAKRAEAQAEKEPIRKALFALLGETPKTASTLISELEGDIELKPQSVASLMKPFLEDGTVVKETVKVAGVKGTHVGYKLA